jgi:DNA-binding MarR family transcriptional regulator
VGREVHRTDRRAPSGLTDAEYRALFAFRRGLRRFLRWSEERALAAGITPTQHQLLLAVRAASDPLGPTVGELAGDLNLKHHSMVGLIDRAEEAGLVRRVRDERDHRVVRVLLSDLGASGLAGLSTQHLEELIRLQPRLAPIWQGLDPDGGGPDAAGRRSSHIRNTG